MESMLWGVAAMVVKDVVKNPYLKGRDYERNVRQVYRDVDNLKITMAHVKANCQDEDFETGPHAPYIKRADRQLKDAYRTLKKNYPRKAGLTKRLDYAATPGAEMHLLDIGKEANQTSRGLGDLLSEIRFAKIGKSKDEEPPPKPTLGGALPLAVGGMAMDEEAVADDSSSTGSIASDQNSLFDRVMRRPSAASAHSPSSSTSSRSRKHSSASRRTRSHSTGEQSQALPSSSDSKQQRLDVILEGSAEREHALDNLQVGIDNIMAAPDEEHEGEAMKYMEYSLAEVLRLQKTQGFSGSPLDEDLGDAVEDLDDSMNTLLGAKGEKEKKYAMKRLCHALEDVDRALAQRQKHNERVAERRQQQQQPLLTEPVREPVREVLPTQQPTRGRLRRQNTSDGSKNRRYSMYK